MTVIVIVRKDRKACIASDSQVNQGDIIDPGDNRINQQKIHLFNGSYIGLTGTIAHHSVLRSLIKRYPQKLNFNSVDDIFETFRSIHEILKNEYYLLTEEDDDDQEYESNQLQGVICNPTGIYHFQGYREISEISRYWASGSGTKIALGALHAGYSLLDDVEHIGTLAVAAACQLDQSCGPPIDSYVVDLQS